MKNLNQRETSDSAWMHLSILPCDSDNRARQQRGCKRSRQPLRTHVGIRGIQPDQPDLVRDPFDLVATVTFTHAKEARTTEMFYAGADTWKFRFTGTRTGAWSVSTSSSDSDLDGYTGYVTVCPRSKKANTYVEKPIYITGLACYYVLAESHCIEIGRI